MQGAEDDQVTAAREYTAFLDPFPPADAGLSCTWRGCTMPGQHLGPWCSGVLLCDGHQERLVEALNAPVRGKGVKQGRLLRDMMKAAHASRYTMVRINYGRSGPPPLTPEQGFAVDLWNRLTQRCNALALLRPRRRGRSFLDV